MSDNTSFLEAVDDPEVAKKYLTYALRHITLAAAELDSVEAFLEALRGFPGIVDIIDTNDNLQSGAAAVLFRINQKISDPGKSILSKTQIEELRKVISRWRRR
ncbi:MAG: hypothetical protein JRN21_09760 [Nitrososphaerota archaeon]|nr:hypothetical protein [Nitrososphaerota archaeon]